MLMLTLPPVNREDLVREVMSHPLVDAVRINTGAFSPFNPEETLRRLQIVAKRFGKPLWVDLKGRQLRVAHWAVSDFGRIRLNRVVRLEAGAAPVVRFRGDKTRYRVTHADGDTIFVDPPLNDVVGEGQSVNVVQGRLSLVDERYLTEADIGYVTAAARLGIGRFLLSYAESPADAEEVEHLAVLCEGTQLDTEPACLLKVESLVGVAAIETLRAGRANRNLMAARDDLGVNLDGDQERMHAALARIIAADADAFVGSKVFASIERGELVGCADVCDLAYLWHLGYRNVLFSDELTRHFSEAMQAWADAQKWLLREAHAPADGAIADDSWRHAL